MPLCAYLHHVSIVAAHVSGRKLQVVVGGERGELHLQLAAWQLRQGRSVWSETMGLSWCVRRDKWEYQDKRGARSGWRLESGGAVKRMPRGLGTSEERLRAQT
jgi:hypothetical protein